MIDSFTDYLQARIKGSKHSTYRICKVAKVSQSSVSRFLNGKLSLRLTIADRLLSALNQLEGISNSSIFSVSNPVNEGIRLCITLLDGEAGWYHFIRLIPLRLRSTCFTMSLVIGIVEGLSSIHVCGKLSTDQLSREFIGIVKGMTLATKLRNCSLETMSLKCSRAILV